MPKVSIPHRYAENALVRRIITVFVKFQSLIGMLKTLLKKLADAIVMEFQSLIGMLKTV